MAKCVIVYWSMTGNTEAMARAVAQGCREAGAETELLEAGRADAAAVLAADRLALGCPAMGDEVLEESEFAPFFDDIEPRLAGKTVALFGSYGWGDGQWMRDWQQRVEKTGAVLVNGEGLIVQETPDEAALARCRALGAALAGS